MLIRVRAATSGTLAIARRELQAYFNSPMAYLVAALFLGLTGYYFVTSISVPFAEASASSYLVQSARVLGLWVPLLTMRLLAEEEKLGTLELLQTAPISDGALVLGKFFASVAIVTVTASATIYYVILLFWFGSPDLGPIVAGYFGLILYGSAAVSAGLFASSLTSNQLVAGGVGLTLMLFLTIADQAAEVVHGWPSDVLSKIAFNTHYTDFAVGIIDTSRVVFFLSFSAVFLFLATMVVGSRRWR